MRVFYLYDGEWPEAATRVRKQTRALLDAGHEVLLLCRNVGRRARRERDGGLEVRRLPTFPGPLNGPLNFPLFVSPVWLREILRAIREFRPDVLCVEDLPMAPTVVAVGRARGIPVVYDMGEVYPEFLRGLHETRRTSLANKILRNPTAADWLEKWVLARADRTAVVSEESARRAVDRGAPPDAVVIVGNTPEDPGSLSAPTECPDVISDLADRPVALFVGILIHDRGLHETVEAMAQVVETLPEAALVVVGDGKEKVALEDRVRTLSLEGHVRFAGWQQHRDLPAFYQRARVGLLPFLPVGQIKITLANKLFDYLGAGLPVLASDVPPMRRIVQSARVGSLCTPGDIGSLSEGLLSMLTLPDEEWDAMRERALALIEDEYSWQHDARRWIQAVEAVGTGAGGRSTA